MSPIKKYCDHWRLSDPVLLASTRTSEVFKVRFDNSFAVLKILKNKSESRAAAILRCFQGRGAVNILNSDDGAHLLEFIDGASLRSLVDQGNDDHATVIICDVLNQIHRVSTSAPNPSGVASMEQNFRSLFSKARNQTCESIFYDGAKVAENLIETEQEVRILHGDIHHENILQSPTRGWLTIDPKGVIGERTYDAANAFYNPMEFLNSTDIKNSIKQRSRIFSQRLGLDQKRMLEFAFAFGCLRAAWFMEDGQEDRFSLRMARTIREVLEEL